MNRRQYLLAAATASVAGCSALSGDGDGDGTTEGNSGPSLAEWRRWVPAGRVRDTSTGAVSANDIGTMLDEFPERVYAQFDLDQLTTVYGIDTADLSWLVSLRRNGRTQSVVMLGSFEPDTVIESLDPPEEAVERQGNYRVVDDRIAVGESALVLATEYQQFLDAEAGSNPYLGANDSDWNRLLTDIQDGTIVIATQGAPPYHGSLDVTKAGGKTTASDDGGTRTTEYLHFESADRARTVADTRQDELVREAKSDPESELVSFERNGDRIVITVESPTFEALL